MLKKRLKPVYLIFLALPLVYFLLWSSKTDVPAFNSKHLDYLFFSVKASKPATFNLTAGKDTLITWDVNSGGYRNLEYVGRINDSTGFCLEVNKLSINDTLTFLGFNLYHNNQLFSLCNGIKKQCTVVNAIITENNNTLIAVVQKSGMPVSIHINPSSNWKTNDIDSRFNLFIALIFTITFFLLFVCAPPVRYFIVSVIISIMVMIVCFIAKTDTIGRVTMTNSSPMKGAEIFYNHTPLFNPDKRLSSDSATTAYSVPINFVSDGFLRFDVEEGTKELKEFKLKTKMGIFGWSYDLASVPQKNLVLNDLVLHGNTFYLTGNDPYIKLVSTYFTNRIKWLIFLESNTFIFITLIVFLILICIHRFAGFINKIRFKPAYFSFLLIPLTYGIIVQPWEKKNVSSYSDYIYFSVRTSKPSVVSLCNNKRILASWNLNSPAFKYIQYKGFPHDSAGLYLKVENLSANDTISLLSVNYYHKDHVYQLLDKNKSVCKINNALLLDSSGEFNAVVQKTEMPVTVKLLPLNMLKKDQPDKPMTTIILLVFFIMFIVVVLAAPNPKYFIVLSIITSLMMFVFFWICGDIQNKINFTTSSPVKHTQLFFNDNPAFSALKKSFFFKEGNTLRSQVDISKYNFLRIDIAEDTREIKNLHIFSKTGILKNSWDYSTILSDDILINDIIKHGTTYYVCGDDPYVVLTSSGQIHSIRWLILVRQNIFFFFTILFFLVLLFANKLSKKPMHSTFFFVVVFLTISSSGLIIRVFNSDRLYILKEKRYAEQLPAVQLDSSMVFIKKLDNYINDQIPGRSNIISMNNLIEFSIFKQLANNNTIHYGKDGWMFFVGNGAREVYENKNPLTSKEMEQMKDVLVARRDWLRERGIHYYLMFPPGSFLIYEEKLGPRMYRHNPVSKIDQLLDYLKLHSDLDIIDIYTTIMNAKKKYPYELYYKDDPHWNYMGAYFAYQAMINCIKKDYPNIGEPLAYNDIEWTKFDNKEFSQGIYKHMALDNFFPSTDYFPKSKKMMTATDTLYPLYPQYMSLTATVSLLNSRVSTPSMLMFRDSFSIWLMTYLSHNFERSTYLWTPSFYPYVIEKEKPDIVIQEMAAHVIGLIIGSNPPLPELKDTISDKPE